MMSLCHNVRMCIMLAKVALTKFMLVLFFFEFEEKKLYFSALEGLCY